MPVSRVIPGQPHRASATAHNRFLETADAVQRGLGSAAESEQATHNMISVRNDYAFALMRHAPIGIDMPIPDQNLTGNSDDKTRAEAYRHRHIYSATKPQARHASRHAVLLETLQPGEIGRAVAMGVAVANVVGGKKNNINPFARAAKGGFGMYPDAYYEAWDQGGAAADRVRDRRWFFTDQRFQAQQGPGNSIVSDVLYNAPSISWPPRASLWDSHNLTGTEYACTGTGSFICQNSRWNVLWSDCSDNCSVARFPELDAGGVDYGLDLPCTEGATVVGIPCRPETRYVGEVLLGNESDSFAKESCSFHRICVRECQDTGGGSYAWTLTHDCDGIPGSPATDCECPSLDTIIYPCTANSEPRHVVFGCTAVTTTTTGNPSTTTHPPCGGDCTATCVYDSGGLNAYIWDLTDGCAGGNAGLPIPCHCTLQSLPLYCDPEECGRVIYGNCTQYVPLPITTTAAPGVTTTQPPPPTCTDTCTWTCGRPAQGFGRLGWYITDPCLPLGCCAHCPPPTGLCCPANIGETQVKNCGTVNVGGTFPPCTTSSPPVTTTAAPTTTTPPTTTSDGVCGLCRWAYFVPPSDWFIQLNNCIGACVCDPPASPGTGGDEEWTVCYAFA